MPQRRSPQLGRIKQVRQEFLFRIVRRDPVRPLLALTLLLVPFISLGLVLDRQGYGFFGGLLVGTAVGGSLTWFTAQINLYSGTGVRFAGVEAERYTTKELEKITGHRLVHGLEFEGRDVDHVMVGHSGVFAIETKWTSAAISLDPDDLVLKTFIERAWWAAGRIDALVRLGARVPIQVRPILVLWGPGAPQNVSPATTIAGVLILIGREADGWPRVFESQRLAEDLVERSLQIILDFQRRQLNQLSVEGTQGGRE